MSKTKVVNLFKESYDVYIGRDNMGRGADKIEIGKRGWLGNPYHMKQNNELSRKIVLDKFKDYFYTRIKLDEEFRKAVHELKGKTLGCYCKPKSCHGDIIVDYLNNLEEDETDE